MPRDHRPAPDLVSRYLRQSPQPLQALCFLLPFLVVYELGLLKVAHAKSQPIIAEVVLQRFFQLFGVTDPRLSYHLPAFVIVVVLLCMHLARRDPWRWEMKFYALMLLESVVLAAPLFVFALVMFRAEPQPAAINDLFDSPWTVGILESIGAGVYEEFVYRLIGIAVVHGILADVLALPKSWSAGGAVAVTAVVFSLAHFYNRANPFEWGKFLFYVVAGAFFAAIYLLRGLGVVAGTHAMYDMLVVVLKLGQG